MATRRFGALVLLLAGLAMPARADQANFVVDLPTDPASLDPHLQWDPDSYAVYRNVFDNVLTRDAAGTIVPQVATAWRYEDPTHVVLTIRDGIRFHDGSALTPEDVAFSARRITDPQFKSPQLSQFDQIVAADAIGPHEVRLTTRTPYPVLLAQLTKLSVVPKAAAERLGERFNQQPIGSGPTGSSRGRAASPSCSPPTTSTGAASRRFPGSSCTRSATRARGSPTCAPAGPTSRACYRPTMPTR